MGENNFDGIDIERRNHLRIIYKHSQTCTLKLKGEIYDVCDISEGGIKFINNKKKDLGNRIRGELVLLNGDSIMIDGNIIWEKNGYVGVSLNSYIPADVIEKEQKYHILNIDLPRD